MDIRDDRFDSILRKFLGQLAPGEQLGPDSDLRRLGLDSLATIRLVMLLEDDLGIAFPDDALDYATFATTSSLWAVVSGLMAEAGSAPDGATR